MSSAWKDVEVIRPIDGEDILSIPLPVENTSTLVSGGNIGGNISNGGITPKLTNDTNKGEQDKSLILGVRSDGTSGTASAIRNDGTSKNKNAWGFGHVKNDETPVTDVKYDDTFTTTIVKNDHSSAGNSGSPLQTGINGDGTWVDTGRRNRHASRGKSQQNCDPFFHEQQQGRCPFTENEPDTASVSEYLKSFTEVSSYHARLHENDLSDTENELPNDIAKNYGERRTSEYVKLDARGEVTRERESGFHDSAAISGDANSISKPDEMDDADDSIDAMGRRASRRRSLQEKSLLSTPQLFICGSLAGMIGKTATAPIDRVRILYQVNPDRFFSARKAWKTTSKIIENTGATGLWRGNVAVMVRVIPYAGTQFTTFPLYEKWLRYSIKNAEDSRAYLRFISGAMAGATATIVTYPFDLIRARMAAHWSKKPKYPSTFSGISQIVAKEGLFGLSRGLTPTLIGIVPYSGMSFMIFETAKSNYIRATEQTDIPMIARLLMGGVAGLVGQYCAYPFHVARRRLQVQETTKRSSRSASFLGVFTQIYRQEGVVRGLFKGASLTMIKGPLSVAVAFVANDTLKRSIRDVVPKTETNPLFGVSEPDDDMSRLMSRLKSKTDTQSPQDFPDSTNALMLKDRYTDRYDSSGASITIGCIEKVDMDDALTVAAHSVAPPLPAAKDALQTKKSAENEIAMTNPPSGQTQIPQSVPISALTSLCIGSVAGAVAKTVIAPMDRIKILYQISSERKFAWAAAGKTAKMIHKNSGFIGFFKGHGATLMRVMPHAGISYTAFPRYEHWLKENIDADVKYIRFFAGSLTGMTATTISYPLDMMRARMAAHWGTNLLHVSYWEAFRSRIQNHGFFSLWSGLRPTLLGNAPYAGISFGLFENLKPRIPAVGSEKSWASLVSVFDPSCNRVGVANMPNSTANTTSPGQTSAWTESEIGVIRLAAGGLAGLTAQALTYPSDIVRRRMQVADKSLYRHEMDALFTIYRTEGLVGGLFKGLSMNFIKGPIAMTISFNLNDYLKSRFLET